MSLPAPTYNQSNWRYNLTLGALGVVYGDVGTSPLYAMHVTMDVLPANLLNILGILSLIFWSLIIVISVKCVGIIFNANNHGEGGIMALLALLKQTTGMQRFYTIMAIFGAGLLLGDAMLTPAISVISAVEGLYVLSPDLQRFILPIGCFILMALFLIQSRGSARLGSYFGPVILLWFLSIAMTGTLALIENPTVLKAVNPWYAIEFLRFNGWHGYILLGGVFLVVTGGEALYADLGYFGKNPIRRSWYFIALPCLLLNYFGQGAWLLLHPDDVTNPFFLIVPGWFYLPLLFLATLATVIASQAVISATFSITRQAILLGLYPKLPIIQTNDTTYGQIYIPQVNLFLATGTFILLLIFQNSANLAHAYGIAVNMEMLLVTILVACAAVKVWKWSLTQTILLFSIFLFFDLVFLGANLHKFLTGGWLPLVFAALVSVVMYTWNAGMNYLASSFYISKQEMQKIIRQLHYHCLHKVPVTAIFITDIYDMSGGSFLHFLKLTQTVPSHILIVSYTVENIPRVPYRDHFELVKLDDNIVQLILHFGFMDIISIPQALYVANDRGILPFQVDVDKTTYFIDIPNIIASRSKKSLRFYWQEKLFAFLMRNYSAHLNIEFYQLPFNRTLGVGSYCTL